MCQGKEQQVFKLLRFKFCKHNTFKMTVLKNPGYLSQRYDKVFKEIVHMSMIEKELQNTHE